MPTAIGSPGRQAHPLGREFCFSLDACIESGGVRELISAACCLQERARSSVSFPPNPVLQSLWHGVLGKLAKKRQLSAGLRGGSRPARVGNVVGHRQDGFELPFPAHPELSRIPSFPEGFAL